MTKQVIVHIGMGKTGSSFIQSQLAQQAGELEQKGILYPYHESFKHASEGKISSGNGSLLLDQGYEIPTGSDRVIYSSELLFTSLLEGYRIDQLVESVAKADAKLCVFIYVRDFFEFSFSSWGQSIKRELATNSYQEFMLAGYPNMIYQLVMMWLNLSKRFNFDIQLYNYSRHKRDVYHHFMTTLFPEEPVAHRLNDSDRPKRVNRSLTLAEYELQRAFNIYYKKPSSSLISDKLVNQLPNIASQTPSLNQAFYKQIVASAKPIIEQLNQQIANSEEQVSIEPYESLNQTNQQDSGEYRFNQNQIHLIARSVSNKLKGYEQKIRELKQEVKRAKQT